MFFFKGGVRCETADHTEKFLLWLVEGKNEVDFFTALQTGLIYPYVDEEGKKIKDTYESRVGLLKIFCMQTRYRAPQQHYSFYFLLDQEFRAEYVLKGFGCGADGFMFKARGRLLRKDDAMGLVKNLVSKEYLRAQGPLPKLLQARMITRTLVEDLREIKTRVIRRTK